MGISPTISHVDLLLRSDRSFRSQKTGMLKYSTAECSNADLPSTYLMTRDDATSVQALPELSPLPSIQVNRQRNVSEPYASSSSGNSRSFSTFANRSVIRVTLSKLRKVSEQELYWKEQKFHAPCNDSLSLNKINERNPRDTLEANLVPRRC